MANLESSFSTDTKTLLSSYVFLLPRFFSKMVRTDGQWKFNVRKVPVSRERAMIVGKKISSCVKEISLCIADSFLEALDTR